MINLDILGAGLFGGLFRSSLSFTLLCVLVIALGAFVIARRRALASAGGDPHELHSRPVYYGVNAALMSAVPSLLLLVTWMIAQPIFLQSSVSQMIGEDEVSAVGSLDLVMSDVQRLADGLDQAVAEGAILQSHAADPSLEIDVIKQELAGVGVALGSNVSQNSLAAAQAYRAGAAAGNTWRTIAVIGLALLGAAFAVMRSDALFRARNAVETGILAVLIAAASLAILTTVGIVLSLVFNTFAFFDRYGTGLLTADLTPVHVAEVVAEDPAQFAAYLGYEPGTAPAAGDINDEDIAHLHELAKSDRELGATFFSYTSRLTAGVGDFFTNTVWQPSFSGRGGASSLGILPLLWGTFYISIVALLVAVPIGLFSAIYLSEYASPRMRAIVKPLLEILAGIPTIVYGLFALLIVGPALTSVFAEGGRLGVAWMAGDRSVMTAGLVMGIMLIPFVSSLSDDIINAVPQSMRDGSLGLGATPSETMRNVVLPAALPGIVGAILLAASRAIGETMIVVLGAGAAGRLDLNPFEAMTTVTAKIVSQLTGDSDFSSPEALVAFALGMTLFIVTLGLNVFALYIVRKYREQYE